MKSKKILATISLMFVLLSLLCVQAFALDCEVKINVVDDNGNPVQNAEFSIFSTDNQNPIETQKTNENGNISFFVPLNNSYYIEQKSTPKEYHINTVKTVVTDNTTKEIKFLNPLKRGTIDFTTVKPLQTFTVVNIDTKEDSIIKSNDTGKASAILPYGKYKIKNTDIEFVVDNIVPFEVNNNGVFDFKLPSGVYNNEVFDGYLGMMFNQKGSLQYDVKIETETQTFYLQGYVLNTLNEDVANQLKIYNGTCFLGLYKENILQGFLQYSDYYNMATMQSNVVECVMFGDNSEPNIITNPNITISQPKVIQNIEIIEETKDIPLIEKPSVNTDNSSSNYQNQSIENIVLPKYEVPKLTYAISTFTVDFDFLNLETQENNQVKANAMDFDFSNQLVKEFDLDFTTQQLQKNLDFLYFGFPVLLIISLIFLKRKGLKNEI